MKLDLKIITLVIANLSFCIGCSRVFQPESQPFAIKGVLDLSEWEFEKDGPVRLSGEYEFYWGQHLIPDDFTQFKRFQKAKFVEVPSSWKGHHLNGVKLPGTGYATYRLTVLLSDSRPEKLALKFLDMGTAYTVFANGEKMLSVGKVGVAKENTVPAFLPQIVNLELSFPTLELIYQVSNFHHNRGGAWEVIRLGTEEQIMQLRERRLHFDLILFGSILIIGLYHITVFRIRRNDLSPFFFGLFCLIIVVRLLTTVERYLLHLFPGMNWDWFVRIEYVSYYLSVPLFALFIYGIFSKDFHKPIVSFIVLFGSFFSVMVCLVPTGVFTRTLPIYNLVTVLCMAYALVILVRIVRKRRGASVILIGFLCLIAAVTNDILDGAGIIQTGHYVHFGVFLFIFSQAIILSFRYSSAITTIEKQRQALKKTSKEYRNELSERKHAEAALRTSEEKYRYLLENTKDAIIITTPKGKILDFNQSTLEFFGGRRENLLNMNVLDFYVDPKDRAKFLKLMNRNGYVRDFEVSIKRNGQIREYQATSTAQYAEDGRITAYMSILRDITERKRAFEEIKKSHEKLRALMAHLDSIAERERTAIARDVHDELGGALTSLKIDLTILERKIKNHSKADNLAPYLKEVRSMKRLSDTTLGNMRELVKRLRPGTLDNLGLVAALESQLQEFQKHTEIDCEFRCKATDPLRMKGEESIAVFRIFQETLTNIARHANASKVVVSIDIREEIIYITITDDGIGMLKKKLQTTETFGILGMRERALMFGGSVKIHSQKGEGTTVRIIVPMREV